MHILFKQKDWLLPVALILFLLAVVLFPFAAERTYAGRNETPNQILTYTAGSLTWDSAANVDAETGVAELSLFSSAYQNVEGQNGEKVVAPGTKGTNIVRLKNDADHSITYIAVMYREKEEDTLPVEPVLTDDDAFIDAETYPLPEGVTQAQVVRAVTGTVEANEIQDFDITWLWAYYESDARDVVDTTLGNKAAWEEADDVMAGLYIVVEEESSSDPGPVPSDPDDFDDPDDPNDPDDPYTYPQVPQTGDSSNFTLYLVLMAVSGLILLFLMLERRKEKQCKKS